MAMYGGFPNAVTVPSGFLIFLGLILLSEYLDPIRQFRKYKMKKEAEIKVLKEEIDSLKNLIKINNQEKEMFIENQLNNFRNTH
jgi:hypothetical protein